MFNPNLHSIIISFNEETVEEDLKKIKAMYSGYISKLKYISKGEVLERVYQLDSSYIDFGFLDRSLSNLDKSYVNMVGFIMNSTVVFYGKVDDRILLKDHLMNIKAVNPDEEVVENYLECCETKLKWTIG